MPGNFELAYLDFGTGKSLCSEFVAPDLGLTARAMTWALPRTMGLGLGPSEVL